MLQLSGGMHVPLPLQGRSFNPGHIEYSIQSLSRVKPYLQTHFPSTHVFGFGQSLEFKQIGISALPVVTSGGTSVLSNIFDLYKSSSSIFIDVDPSKLNPEPSADDSKSIFGEICFGDVVVTSFVVVNSTGNVVSISGESVLATVSSSMIRIGFSVGPFKFNAIADLESFLKKKSPDPEPEPEADSTWSLSMTVTGIS